MFTQRARRWLAGVGVILLLLAGAALWFALSPTPIERLREPLAPTWFVPPAP